MVRILSNGEIDDGTSPQPLQQRRPALPQQPPMSNNGPRMPNGPLELFNYVNERLVAFGLPRINLGDYVVEPVHLVLGLLSLVLFGPMALIAVAIVIYISQQDRDQTVSQPSANPQSTSQPTTSPRQNVNSPKKPFGGSGQRLGS